MCKTYNYCIKYLHLLVYVFLFNLLYRVSWFYLYLINLAIQSSLIKPDWVNTSGI